MGVVEGFQKLPRIWSMWYVFQGGCEDVSTKERGHTAFSEICGHCISCGLYNSQITGCRNIVCNQIHLHRLPFAKVFPRYLLKVSVMITGYGGTPVWGVPTSSEGHLCLVSILHFGHCEIHTGFMVQVLSIHIHNYSRIYSNILSDRREIYCYKTCTLFSKKKHLMADLRDVTLNILVAWSHESSLT